VDKVAGRGVARCLVLLAALCILVACDIQVQPAGPPSGCASAACPPPSRPAAAAHLYHAQRFSVRYFDPWQVVSSDANSVQLAAATRYGDLTVQIASGAVRDGTSAQALLARVRQNLDTSQLAGLQDQGPIYGAAIGYVSGAGETLTATADQPNAPSVPVYLELMASVQGTTGLVFLATSTLDPNSPDPTSPRQVPNGEYDRIVNSVTWA
jgi:hypothetical protein